MPINFNVRIGISGNNLDYTTFFDQVSDDINYCSFSLESKFILYYLTSLEIVKLDIKQKVPFPALVPD